MSNQLFYRDGRWLTFGQIKKLNEKTVEKVSEPKTTKKSKKVEEPKDEE